MDHLLSYFTSSIIINVKLASINMHTCAVYIRQQKFYFLLPDFES